MKDLLAESNLDDLQAKIEKLEEENAMLKSMMSDDSESFGDIAKICGCALWDYPGQVIRDVVLMKEALWDCLTRLETCGSAEDKNLAAEYKTTFGEVFLKDL